MIYNMVFTVIVLFLIVWTLSKKPGTKDYFFVTTVSYGICAGISVSGLIINGINFADMATGIIGVALCIFSYFQYQNCNWKW